MPHSDSDSGGLQWSPECEFLNKFLANGDEVVQAHNGKWTLSNCLLVSISWETLKILKPSVTLGNFFFSRSKIVLACEYNEYVDACTQSYHNTCWAFSSCSFIFSLLCFCLPPFFSPPAPYLHLPPIPGNLCWQPCKISLLIWLPLC